MAGTKAGGRKCALTNKEKYGPDYYVRIGKKGGQNGRTGGFASSVHGKDGMTGRERASVVGSLGGKISRRQKRVA